MFGGKIVRLVNSIDHISVSMTTSNALYIFFLFEENEKNARVEMHENIEKLTTQLGSEREKVSEVNTEQCFFCLQMFFIDLYIFFF